MPVKNLIGQKFGRLTVIERDKSKKGGAAYWICQCECGNITSVRSDALTTAKNPTKSCGCLAKEKAKEKIDKNSLVGKKFNRLTVIKRDETKEIGHHKSIYWICQCDCGNFVSVSTADLNSGHTKSCGCLKLEMLKERNENDLTGQKFGMLTAIKKMDIKNLKNEYLWLFKCDCGENYIASGTQVKNGHIFSCGCIKSKGEQLIRKILQENNIQYIKEYVFKDLVSNKNAYLRFDFALIDENQKVVRLIEFDGEQHYKKNSKFYSPQLTLNDELKNKYCKNNQIPLVRIPYSKINTITLETLLGSEYLI